MANNRVPDLELLEDGSRSRAAIIGTCASKVALGAVLILGFSSAALAQSALESCKRQIFQHADMNSDGMLSPKEAAAHPLNLDQRFFGFADKDQNGALDRHEYENALAFVSCELCPALPDCHAP